MTHDEMIAVIAAHKAGKTIEVRSKRDGNDTWDAARDPVWNFFDWNYRIKPTSKKRLIRVEELPPVFWVKHLREVFYLVISTDEKQLYISAAGCPGSIRINECLTAGWKFSADRKTWNSFEVEESQ